jgi:hypothetical protein
MVTVRPHAGADQHASTFGHDLPAMQRCDETKQERLATRSIQREAERFNSRTPDLDFGQFLRGV